MSQRKTESRIDRLKTLRTQWAFANILAAADKRKGEKLKSEINEEAEYLASQDWDHASERVEEIDDTIAMLGHSIAEQTEAELKAEACDLAGTDTYEAALVEYGLRDPPEELSKEARLEKARAIQEDIDTVGSALRDETVADMQAEVAELANADDYEAALEAIEL